MRPAHDPEKAGRVIMRADNADPPWMLMGIVFAAAFAIRGGLASGFDGLYGQDAYHYYDEGQRLSPGDWQPRFVSVGYPLLLAVAKYFFGPGPLVSQLPGLLLGALTPAGVLWLAWLLTRQRPLSLLAGCLACLTPFAIRSSLVIMGDASALGLMTLGLCCGVRYIERPVLLRGIMAAGCLALSIMVRHASFLALFPLAVYAWFCRASFPRRHAVVLSVVFVLACLPELIHLRREVQSVHLLQGWSLFNAFRSQFLTLDGLLQYEWPAVIMHIKTLGGWSFLNPVWLVCAMAGHGALKPYRASRLFLVLWATVWFLAVAGLPLVNPRYLLPLIVPLSICAASGLIYLMDKLTAQPVAARLWRPAIAVLVVCGVAGMGIGVYRSVGEIFQRKACELEMAAWIEARIPEDAQIIAFDVAHAALHYTSRRVIHLHEFDPAALEIGDGNTQELYLIWNEAQAVRVAQRPAGPGDPMPRFADNVRWFRQRASQTPVARVCAWDVVRINR